MRLPFSKMQALGNDFVVFDGVAQAVRLTPDQARWLADRRLGVGCDQVLSLEPAVGAGVDFFYRIFNADGSEASQCGNGARCVARFAVDAGLSSSESLLLETRSTRLRTWLLADGEVRVDMGVPEFDPVAVPFLAPERADRYDLEVEGETIPLWVLGLGNPHAVLAVSDVNMAPVDRLGPVIERHPRFPERTNTGFMQVLDRNAIALRVFERGSGETLACGSGACAAAVAGRAAGLLDASVRVHQRGGILKVDWEGEGRPVFASGPATTVFTGSVNL
ncbi:MAG: diaminopimelate epimerase [Gammaproteobacteria bacterium]|nr:diaminopimelate epimerase [Gammaproteobacteria bacterium]